MIQLMGFAIIASYFIFTSKRSSIGRITVTTGLAIGMVFLLCHVPTYAQGQLGPGGPRRGLKRPAVVARALLGRLNLTEEQRVQVQDITKRSGAQTREIGKQLRPLLSALKDAIETYPLNEELVRNAANAVSVSQLEMTMLRARVRSEMYGVLTPEQQQRALKLRNRLETRLKQGRGRPQFRERGRPPFRDRGRPPFRDRGRPPFRDR